MTNDELKIFGSDVYSMARRILDGTSEPTPANSQTNHGVASLIATAATMWERSITARERQATAIEAVTRAIDDPAWGGAFNETARRIADALDRGSKPAQASPREWPRE